MGLESPWQVHGWGAITCGQTGFKWLPQIKAGGDLSLVLPLSVRSTALCSPLRSDRADTDQRKVPFLKDVGADGPPCLPRAQTQDRQTGPSGAWAGLVCPLPGNTQQHSGQASSPSRGFCPGCSVRLGSHRVHGVMGGVPPRFVTHRKALLFRLLPLPGCLLFASIYGLSED